MALLRGSRGDPFGPSGAQRAAARLLPLAAPLSPLRPRPWNVGAPAGHAPGSLLLQRWPGHLRVPSLGAHWGAPSTTRAQSPSKYPSCYATHPEATGAPPLFWDVRDIHRSPLTGWPRSTVHILFPLRIVPPRVLTQSLDVGRASRAPQSNPRFRASHRATTGRCRGRLSRIISAALGIRLVHLRAGPSPARARARPPCPGLQQLNEAQFLAAPRPSRHPFRGLFRGPRSAGPSAAPTCSGASLLFLGHNASSQTRSGTPPARAIFCVDSAPACVFTQDPGSGRGMGRRLLSPPAQLRPSFQGRDGGSAAPKTDPPGYHLSPDTDRPGTAHFIRIIAGPTGARGLCVRHLWVLGQAPPP
ncbi:hypothetical protein NDU88_006086 [Pleurodeles waltl]|uniref:Uncharacterized protein n=1 Tax=Pleurodeles waltl TaxID=8319 RepID=A0AAV7UNL5_PLEWA|nr:hypothetical protein NDU88_006086 [Pleurodeles waltl]